MSAFASAASLQDNFNNSVDYVPNSIDDSVNLNYDLTKVVCMTHNGCCGYEAVMRFLEVKTSVRDFVDNVLSR